MGEFATQVTALQKELQTQDGAKTDQTPARPKTVSTEESTRRRRLERELRAIVRPVLIDIAENTPEIAGARRKRVITRDGRSRLAWGAKLEPTQKDKKSATALIDIVGRSPNPLYRWRGKELANFVGYARELFPEGVTLVDYNHLDVTLSRDMERVLVQSAASGQQEAPIEEVLADVSTIFPHLAVGLMQPHSTRNGLSVTDGGIIVARGLDGRPPVDSRIITVRQLREAFGLPQPK